MDLTGMWERPRRRRIRGWSGLASLAGVTGNKTSRYR